MWGILSVIGIATASAAKHLMDMNNAENEKMKKDKEIEKLKRQVSDLERDKTYANIESLLSERTRDTEAEKKAKAYEYMEEAAWIIYFKKKLEEMYEENPDEEFYNAQMEIQNEKWKHNEEELGMYRPEGITDEAIYNLFENKIKTYLKASREADNEAAATNNPGSNNNDENK